MIQLLPIKDYIQTMLEVHLGHSFTQNCFGSLYYFCFGHMIWHVVFLPSFMCAMRFQLSLC